MKIRNGFVSNSSSSSFILAFDEENVDKDLIKQKLFDGKDGYVSYYFNRCDDDVMLNIDDLCKFIADTISPATVDKLRETFECITSYDDPECPEYPDFKLTGEEMEKVWNEYNKKHGEYISKKLEEFKQEYQGKNLFVGEFSDDTTIGSHVEHSGLLSPITVLKINNH